MLTPYKPAHRDYVLTLAHGSLNVTGAARVTSRSPAPNGSVSVRYTTLMGLPRYRRLPAHRLTLHPLSDFWNGKDDA